MRNFIISVVHFIIIEGIFVLITMGVVALICWKCKRLNLVSFRNGIAYAGCGYMVLGLMSLIGNENLKSSQRYWKMNQQIRKSYNDVSQEFAKSTDKSFMFLVRSGIIGLTLMIISFFI